MNAMVRISPVDKRYGAKANRPDALASSPAALCVDIIRQG